MRVTPRPFGPVAALVVALILMALFTPMASAQTPRITIHGTWVDRCTAGGPPVAAGPQGSSFQVDMADFPALPAGGVFVTVTTPDGRVFDVNSDLADLPKPPPPPPAPSAQPALTQALLNPVDASVTIPTTLGWPIGCYTVTVATPDTSTPAKPSTEVKASRQLRLQPFVFPTQPDNLQLMVQAVGTIQPTGTSPVVVNVSGRGPVGGPLPALSLIRPDGSILGLPAPIASGSPGGFVSAAGITLPPLSATGVYTVVASTGADAVKDKATRAQFTLTAPASTPRGNAVLTMNPSSALVAHNPLHAPPVITIGGRGLPAGDVNVVLVLPNGGRVAGKVKVNTSGNLAVPPFVLNRYHPEGQYRFEVYSVPPPDQPSVLLAAISWRVTP